MLVEACKLIFNEHPTEMLYLATKNDNLYSEAKHFTSPVSDNCHVWTSNNTRTKKNILLYIFKEIGVAPAEFEIDLVPMSENTVNDNSED